MIEIAIVLFLVYIAAWWLWTQYVYNPFLGLNGGPEEGQWLFMMAITFVTLPFMLLAPFVALIWLGWLTGGAPDHVDRANYARKMHQNHRKSAAAPSSEYLREMERLARVRDLRLSQARNR